MDRNLFLLRSKVVYLGHVLDKDGLHPIEAKVQAIKDAPESVNHTHLAFLSLINFTINFFQTFPPHSHLALFSLEQAPEVALGY